MKPRKSILVWNTTLEVSRKYDMVKSSLLLFSCQIASNSLRPHGSQHTRPLCPPLSPWVCSNSCPLSQWCYPTILSAVVSFSSCFQSFPPLGSFLMSQLFALGGQSIGASVSASVLPLNIQDWFSLAWTGWISLQSKGLSGVFSSTTESAIIIQISLPSWASLSPSIPPSRSH